MATNLPGPRIVDAPAPAPVHIPTSPAGAGGSLWPHRRLILGAALCASVLAGGYAFLQPRSYEAVTTLMAYPSKLGDAPTLPVAAANFVPIVESPAIAEAVIKELGLGNSPRSITVAGFLEDGLFVNPRGGGTTLLDVRVRLDSPDLAARAANRVAEHAVAASRQLSQDEALDARDQLKAQFDDARGRYEAAAGRLEAFRKTAEIESLRRDVEAMLKERGDLLSLALEVEAERAKLARAEQELAARGKTETVTRALTRDPALTEAARQAATGSLVDLKMNEQVLNGVYFELDALVAQTRARLASLEERLGQAGVEIRALAGSSGKLAKLYALEKTAAELAIEIQIAQKAYELAGNQYENARLDVSSRSAQLQQLAPAYPPERPLPRRALMYAALAFLLAGALAAGTVWAASLPRSPDTP